MLNSKENGFSLIELIVVLIITAILAQLGFAAFNRYARRTRAFAAKTALKNIKRECESNRDLEAQETFTLLPIKGYSIATRNTNSCLGQSSDGKVGLIAENQKEIPNYFYDYLLGIMSCSFQNIQLNYPNCDVNNFGNNRKKMGPNIFNGDKKLAGEFTGLETKDRGYYYIDLKPNTLKKGEKMALLNPGGQLDLEIYLLGTNEEISSGTVIKNQKYTNQLNKGNFKICMSGGSFNWSPTVCSAIMPTEKANQIGIGYSRGSYDIHYDGGSMSGSGAFAAGSTTTNQTVIGQFDNSTKEKIQKNLNQHKAEGHQSTSFTNFNGELNNLIHVDTTTMDYGKTEWQKVARKGNLYRFFKDGGITTPGDTYSQEDWKDKKGFN